jgi:amino acid adenylation domain-containing protein
MSDNSKGLRNLSAEQKRAYLAQLLRKKAQQEASTQTLPLSHGQRALWFIYQLAPQNPAYNLIYAARVHAPLDTALLERAARSLLRRHPILTATYSVKDGQPEQHLHPDLPVSLTVIDAAAWGEAELNQRIEEEGDRPFQLERGPLLRLTAFTRGPEEYVLAVVIHHIVTDFWSFELLIDEFRTLYAAEKLGIQPPAPAGMSYVDYMHWQTEMLAGPEGERHRAYWQEALAGELPALSLPTGRPRPPVQTYRGAFHSFDLDEHLSGRLKTLAHQERVTSFMLLLAAFQTLLYRYTNQEDILVGTPAAARGRADVQRTFGYLANPVVLRADFSANPTFKDLLSQVRQTVIGAIEHQDYPFPLLVERLQPRRDPSYSPLFQTVFVWDQLHQFEGTSGVFAATHAVWFGQSETAARLAQEKLPAEPLLLNQQGAAFDLTLRMAELEGGRLALYFSYNTDLFDAATIARLGEHFQMLLAGIAAQPDQPVGNLPLLTAEERERALVQWNETRADYPADTCVHQLFEAQVEQTPDAVAVVFEGQTLTYQQLNLRANQLAHVLREREIGPESLVGVCMERSLEMVIALLGILKAGAAYVPLDPAYPRDRLEYMIQDARLPVLLTQQRLLETLPESEGTTILALDAEFAWDDKSSLWDANLDSGVGSENAVYMIYTSGSTGRPKGVVNRHRSLTNRLWWMQQMYRLMPDDRVMQKTPFSFDVSVWEFFWPLISGARLVVARPGGHQDPAYMAALIAEQQITTMHFVPSMLQAFLLEPDLERCRSLRQVMCSGEALPFDLQERFFTRFAATELHNLYGPTEAAIDVTSWRCQRGSKDWTVPIGRPIANTQIYILDYAMQPVPIGVAGELYIGGVNVARGYFQRPELTAEKFIRDPFSADPQARLFKTGDLARYRPDGVIEFLGRIDTQVKIRGFRIELGEIEAALSQHPVVKEAVVLAREDAPGDKRLVAYLVIDQARGQDGLYVEELRDFLKQTLPHYMIPAAFVFLDALPLMSNGKVSRKALPAPEFDRPNLEAAYVAPSTPAEETLAKIWSKVLGIERIGVHDNYFSLGGASIQGLQVIAKANAAGLPLTPEMLFEYQTIAELAAVAVASSGAPVDVRNREAVTTSQAKAETVRPSPLPTARNMIIESLGVYLPPKAVSTQDILADCAKPIKFPLEQFTGIYTRRMAGETEFSLDLARKAVDRCLANSKYLPKDIDLLICTNISRVDGPQYRVPFEPNTSAKLKQYFGFSNALVFDVSNACTGMFTAMLITDAFLKAGLIRRGMVVSGEYTTHLTTTAQKELESYLDQRLACLTVGDAGAAVILEQAANNAVGFHELDLYTLGRYCYDCIAKASDQEHGGAIMFTDAVRVAAVNITQALSHAAYTLERAGWQPEILQHIIMHQTSEMSIRDAAREINTYFGREVCNQQNVIVNLRDRGNTATTTHMVALMDRILSGEIKSGEHVIFGITGSGATIGTGLYTFDDLPDRLRRAARGQPPAKASTGAREQPVVTFAPRQTRVRIASIGTADASVKKETLALSEAAAEACIAKSSYSREDIDLLIYAGVYRDEFLSEPALASIIAGGLKINDTIETQQDKKTFAFDLFNGAVGFLNACQVSAEMIHAQKIRRALVVTSEVENNKLARPDELLGIAETGSAAMLAESIDGKTGFGNFVFKYGVEYLESLIAYTRQEHGTTWIHRDQSAALEEHYLRLIDEAVAELLKSEQLELSQIKVVMPPQISPAFVAKVSAALHLDRERVVDIARNGVDLYTSSLPCTLQYVQEQRLVEPGDIGLIVSAGSGLQVGCATYYF